MDPSDLHRPDPTGPIPLYVRVGEVVLAVGHGVDPTWLARELGAPAVEGASPQVLAADLVEVPGPEGAQLERPLVLDYSEGFDPQDLPAPSSPGMVVELEEPVRRQRVATHAVVLSDDGQRLLLTGFFDTYTETDFWTWPGGGIDPGETVPEALERELWEETGHEITGAVPVTVLSWGARGTTGDGQAEDYHGLSVFWAARVPEEREPVVHDVGGSTSSAEWVGLDDPRVTERHADNAVLVERARRALGLG